MTNRTIKIEQKDYGFHSMDSIVFHSMDILMLYGKGKHRESKRDYVTEPVIQAVTYSVFDANQSLATN